LLNFDKILKKNYKIIINDVPKYSRLVELCLLLFLNPKRLLGAFYIIINFSDYIKNHKFYLKNLDISFLKKNFKFKKIENFNYFKLRHDFILKKKL
jgi:hypothetical protein